MCRVTRDGGAGQRTRGGVGGGEGGWRGNIPKVAGKAPSPKGAKLCREAR